MQTTPGPAAWEFVFCLGRTRFDRPSTHTCDVPNRYWDMKNSLYPFGRSGVIQPQRCAPRRH